VRVPGESFGFPRANLNAITPGGKLSLLIHADFFYAAKTTMRRKTTMQKDAATESPRPWSLAGHQFSTAGIS
jgi:hypothetical protein